MTYDGFNWRFHLCVFSVLAVLLTPLWILILDREKPFIALTSRVIPMVVDEEATVSIIIGGLRYRECPGMVYRRIVGAHGEIHTFVGVPANYQPDRVIDNPPIKETVNRTLKLPSLVRGNSKYSSRIEWHCNWTHWVWPIVTDIPPAEFIIK